MKSNSAAWVILGVLSLILLAACDDQSEPRTTHRSLADAASQLRATAKVDTVPLGHVLWNGSAQILVSAECQRRGDAYVLAAQGDGVELRLVYAAEAAAARSFALGRLQSVELRVDVGASPGAVFRADGEDMSDAEVTTTQEFTYGTVSLKSSNDAALRSHASGVRAQFEFRCS